MNILNYVTNKLEINNSIKTTKVRQISRKQIILNMLVGVTIPAGPELMPAVQIKTTTSKQRNLTSFTKLTLKRLRETSSYSTIP